MWACGQQISRQAGQHHAKIDARLQHGGDPGPPLHVQPFHTAHARAWRVNGHVSQLLLRLAHSTLGVKIPQFTQ